MHGTRRRILDAWLVTMLPMLPMLTLTGATGAAGFVTSAGAQVPVRTTGASGRIVGQVLGGQGERLRDATVQLLDVAHAPASSNASGRFVLLEVPSGERRVMVTALGYAPARLTVSVAPDDSAAITVVLERSALELAGVTVSAIPSERDPLAVAQPVTTLGRRDMERSMGATLARTLAWTGGVSERSQGPAASMPVIRGLTGERIVVLHDGQRAGDLAGSAADHGVTIDPLAASQVEIVRGPAALLHGSTALGGVVNVISDDIARVVPSQRLTSVTVNAQSASEGAGALLDIAQPLGAGLVMRLKGGSRSHGDQRLGAGDGRAVLANTSMRNQHGVVALSRVGGSGSGGIALRHYGFEYGLPWRDAPVDGVRLRGARHELTARAESAGGGPFTQLRVDGTAQWYGHDEVLADGQVATALAVRTQQGQLLARTRAVGALHDGALGVSLLARQHGVQGSQALTPPNANSSIAAFAFQEVVPGRPGATGWRGVRLPVAVRVDRVVTTTETTSGFGPAVSRRFTNLSASVGLTVPLRRDASFALNLAQAARVPSPEELFSRAGHAGTGAFEIGNPSLGAEVTRGVDAVLRVERRGLRVQLAAFRSLVDGWVGLYPTGRDTVVRAPGLPDKSLPLVTVAQRDARLMGGEASAEGVVGRHLIVHGTADMLRATEAAGGALPFMPPGRVGGGARWDDGRWQLGGALRHVFAQRRVSADEVPTDAVTLVEAHAGVRLVTGARVQSLVLRLENLGDRLYRDATSRIKDFAPAAGRNVSLLYRVTF